MRALVTFIMAAAFAAGGCKSNNDGSAASGRDESGPDDPQILGITQAIHRGEIDLGKLALEHATGPRVREFAQRMIDDHNEGLRKGEELAVSIHITPTPSRWSQQLEAEGRELASDMRAAVGKDFDAVYMKGMVDGHDEALALLRDTLEKQAVADPLRRELQAIEASVVAHLAHARTVEEGVM